MNAFQNKILPAMQVLDKTVGHIEISIADMIGDEVVWYFNMPHIYTLTGPSSLPVCIMMVEVKLVATRQNRGQEEVIESLPPERSSVAECF